MDRKEGRPSPEPAPTTKKITTSNGTGYRPAGSTSDPEVLLTEYPTYLEWSRRQFMARARSRRRISRELDALACVPRTQTAAKDHFLLKDRELRELARRLNRQARYTGNWVADMGFNLGVEERRAAGLALAERERAA